MVEYKGGYDWADVYEERYHELQKKNNELACRLGTAQTKQDELTGKLGHIEGNRLWKMTSPVRKAVSLISNSDGRRSEKIAKIVSSASKRRNSSGTSDGQEITGSEDVHENDFQNAYHAEAYKQKNPYVTWIEENEKPAASSDFSEEKDGAKFAVLYTEDCGTAKTQLTADLLIGKKYIIFVSRAGRLADGALCEIEEKMRSGRYRMLYGDEDYYIKGTQRRLCPWFKPDWSPDTLLSFMYFGSVVVFTTECVNKLAWYGSSEGFENLYYLCLQAGLNDLADPSSDSCSNSVAHIDKVLFHKEYGGEKSYEEDVSSLDELLKSGNLRRGAEERYSKMKKKALLSHGINADIRSFGEPGICSTDLSESGDEPRVSIVILSKDHPDVLRECLDSVYRKTDYSNYDVTVVDNGSSEENRSAVEALRSDYPFEYVYEKSEFNFSDMCNKGVSHSSGSLIFLMNDDVEVIEKDWMRLMAGQAMRPHVGAVGAKLYYAGTDRMQHIGVTNLTAGPAHKLTTYPDTHDYYYGRNSLNYDMIGVTGAALMVRREIYDAAGGLDTGFPVAYNDVDFCMSIYEKGYYNVQRNDVEFFHHESLSRGNDDKNDSKLLRLVGDMDRLYSKHPGLKGRDPFYNKNLTGHISDYICDVSPAYDDSRKKNAAAEKISAGNYAKINRSDILKFTVDHIRHRGMTCLNEAVILIADGWSYLPGEDNSRFDKWILLYGTKGEMYRVKPDPWYRKDVIDIIPNEQNVDLAGFILRVAEADLEHDDYRIGMMCRDTDSGREVTAWSDSVLKVPHESDREE